ncbi:MAG: NADP-dependent phosphogluconate dehydrogenase, partial [Candidatus Eisenbacteria bacterium]
RLRMGSPPRSGFAPGATRVGRLGMPPPNDLRVVYRREPRVASGISGNAGSQPGRPRADGPERRERATPRGAARSQGVDRGGVVDAGTSGGIWGLANGYCMMVGGSESVCRRLEPLFTTLAPVDGYARVGANGAGHLVKMIHNGIEYGMMQAYAEGFEILKASPYGLDLGRIGGLWQHGSVVRSWLLDLTVDALQEDPALETVSDYVEDSGEGRWTVIESVERAVPAPVLTLALQARFRSRQESSFQGKLLAAMRNKFGGHAVKKA